MRVVLDTNILGSALMEVAGALGLLLQAWQRQHFDLLTCSPQLEELRRTLRKPSTQRRISFHRRGQLLNRLKDRALFVSSLPVVTRPSDPEYDFVLALAEAGRADYLVSGDKSGLLALHKHAGARIVTAREFLDQIS